MKALRMTVGMVAVGGLLSIGLSTPAGATVLGSEGKIAFVRANQIYTMTKAGGSVTQLTSTGKNYRPKWSPDGRKIAYIQEDATGKKNVFEMTATGGSKTKVTTSGTVTTAAVWSPNGATLAFAQGSLGTINLIKATAPFGSASPLTVSDRDDFVSNIAALPDTFSIAWSPNGQDLAVLNNNSEDSPDYGEHLVHGMTNVTPGAVHPEEVIDFTGGECCGEELWTDINYIPNGTVGKSVADRGDEQQFDPPHYTIEYPGFVSQLGDKAGCPSPSGKHMVFVRTVGTTPNIWTATIKGAQRKQIQANGYQPDWQPT
jgi:Tol biopolymer transport system component